MENKNWGKNAWILLHKVSSNINDNNLNEFFKFIDLFNETLPCPICKQHFENNINIIPYNIIDFENNTPLIWSFNIHNLVNRSLNKKQLNFKELNKCKDNWKDEDIIQYLDLVINLLNENNVSFDELIINQLFLNKIKNLIDNQKIKKFIDLKIKEVDKKYL